MRPKRLRTFHPPTGKAEHMRIAGTTLADAIAFEAGEGRVRTAGAEEAMGGMP